MESSLKSKIKKYKKVALYANKLKTRTVFLNELKKIITLKFVFFTVRPENF